MLLLFVVKILFMVFYSYADITYEVHYRYRPQFPVNKPITQSHHYHNTRLLLREKSLVPNGPSIGFQSHFVEIYAGPKLVEFPLEQQMSSESISLRTAIMSQIYGLFDQQTWHQIQMFV